jgi:hypothetical protein
MLRSLFYLLIAVAPLSMAVKVLHSMAVKVLQRIVNTEHDTLTQATSEAKLPDKTP